MRVLAGHPSTPSDQSAQDRSPGLQAGEVHERELAHLRHQVVHRPHRPAKQSSVRSSTVPGAIRAIGGAPPNVQAYSPASGLTVMILGSSLMRRAYPIAGPAERPMTFLTGPWTCEAVPMTHPDQEAAME